MPGSEPRIIKQHFGNRPFRVREAVDAGIPRHEIYACATRAIWSRSRAA